MTSNGTDDIFCKTKYKTGDGYVFNNYTDALVHTYSELARKTHASLDIVPYQETYY